MTSKSKAGCLTRWNESRAMSSTTTRFCYLRFIDRRDKGAVSTEHTIHELGFGKIRCPTSSALIKN